MKSYLSRKSQRICKKKNLSEEFYLMTTREKDVDTAIENCSRDSKFSTVVVSYSVRVYKSLVIC